MSTSPTPNSTSTSTSTTTTSPISSGSYRSRKVLCPKVWKRPHSTIYGKNVEFGSSLYSDKIGEINGRKFNSELPWTMRNSGSSSAASSSAAYNQGYLSNLLLSDYPKKTNTSLAKSGGSYRGIGNNFQCSNYADLLELTNPARFSKRGNPRRRPPVALASSSLISSGGGCVGGGSSSGSGSGSGGRIDFYDQYDGEFSKEIERLNMSSLMLTEPLLTRKVFDNYLDFDHELGVFVPNRGEILNKSNIHDHHHHRTTSSSYNTNDDGRRLLRKKTLLDYDCDHDYHYNHDLNESQMCSSINHSKFVPLPTTTQTYTNILPRHECQLPCSPYGQSADGRKLSLGSINPASYRPSLPSKTTTAHASDGEEFEFQDKSSPFYTDRWAGKTIRHFDSDLYSNANLFKSMIL